MNRIKKNTLRDFYILWSTQSLSQLGSSITSFALTLWLYETTGSALSTAALAICTYVPYVLMSIFAGALTDRWDKKKTMLVCDTIAAICTLVIWALYKMESLKVWHLYLINIFSGFMNTVQQPASEVAMTLIVDKENYQKTSGLKSFSRSLISILNPLIATALYGFAGIDLVIGIDLVTFVIAFVALFTFIDLPNVKDERSENVLKLAKEGLQFLKRTPMILTMFISLGMENFLLAFTRTPILWCIGQIIGWFLVPIMSANMDVIMRNTIPVELQGRVYACRNALQFFTIPIGLFLGGIIVDNVCEPFMANHTNSVLLRNLFGMGKGSGAALMMFILGVAGTALCLCTGRKLKKYKYDEN